MHPVCCGRALAPSLGSRLRHQWRAEQLPTTPALPITPHAPQRWAGKLLCNQLRRRRAGLVARGVHWLMLAPSHAAAPQRRSLQQLLNDPPLLAFAPIPAGQEGAAPHR